MVHESDGPSAGSVSQNWVSRRAPPGWLKQQLLDTAVVLWQLKGMSDGQDCRSPSAGVARCMAIAARVVRVDCFAIIVADK